MRYRCPEQGSTVILQLRYQVGVARCRLEGDAVSQEAAQRYARAQPPSGRLDERPADNCPEHDVSLAAK
jgi:hypothetical protein